MKARWSLCLAVIAGGMLGGEAPAQTVPVDTWFHLDRSSIPHEVVDAETLQSTYASRAVSTTYDADSNSPCALFLGTNRILEDISFGPSGPWSATTNNVLREITILRGNNGGIPNYDLQITVWPTADFAANPMVPAGATPLFQVTVPTRNAALATYLTITNLNGGAGVVIPGNSCFIEAAVLNPNQTTPHSTVGGALIAVNQNTFPSGSTVSAWGRDRNNDGQLVGGTLNAPLPNEHVITLINGGDCNGQPAVMDYVLRGDVAASPPATFTDLGTMTDAGLARSDAYAAGEVRWFRFSLAGDVSDARRTFLDLDTEGSTLAPTNDPIVVLYDNAGNLIAADRQDGSGLQAQMSFGVGNRAANGDGRVFDGVDAELLAADGPFWLGVAGFPAATIDDGWVFTSGSVEAGGISINIRTNSESAAPLAPSVEPNFTLVNGGAPIFAPGVEVADEAPEVPGLLWYKLTLCTNVDGSTPESFFDIDFSRSDLAGSIDQEAFIFDANGNLLFSSDDEGPALLPQFSFGHAGPRPAYSGVPGDPEFTGANGTLPAGTYYLAAGFFDMRELAGAATDGRWFLRPLSGSGVNIQTDVFTGVTECSSACGSADFNGDGDTGTDADIEAFFACLGGSCCDTCGSADFNGDGDTGTDADIEAFFRVLGGGTC